MNHLEKCNFIDQDFYSGVKDIIENARRRIYRNMQNEMLFAYWKIGKMIVERQGGVAKAEYGAGIIKELSEQLTKDFGKGYTTTNLKYMRQFYIRFQKSHTLCDQLSWSHYRLIISLDDEKARDFYIKEAVEGNWSTRQLEHAIHALTYQRYLLSHNNHEVVEETAKIGQEENKQLIIKDPMVFDFAGIDPGSKYFESDLEHALISHLQDFLLELGNGFAFVARQRRFDMDGRNFYVDLVLYNYKLKCFVLIDLKRGDLTHQDIGQMQMYVNYYTRNLMEEGDNPPIGIVLCADKSDTLVSYTLPLDNKQIYASKYMLYLPKEEELRDEINKQREILSQLDQFKDDIIEAVNTPTDQLEKNPRWRDKQ